MDKDRRGADKSWEEIFLLLFCCFLVSGGRREGKGKRERREKSLGGFPRKGERREVNGGKGQF